MGEKIVERQRQKGVESPQRECLLNRNPDNQVERSPSLSRDPRIVDRLLDNGVTPLLLTLMESDPFVMTSGQRLCL